MQEVFNMNDLANDRKLARYIKERYVGSIIYRIHRIGTDKNYIGHTDNLYSRLYSWKGHIHKVKKKIEMRTIHFMIEKYGYDKFELVIELFSNTHNEYLSYESEYVIKYDSYYNGYNDTMTGKGGFCKGCKKMTDGVRNYYISPKYYSEAIESGLKEVKVTSSIIGRIYVNNGVIQKVINPNDLDDYLLNNPGWKRGTLPKPKNLGYVWYNNGKVNRS